MAFKLGMTVDLCMAYNIYAHARVNDLEVKSNWLGRGKISALKPQQIRKQQALNLLKTVGHNKFSFSLKPSVAFTFNYGHTSISCN